MTRKILATALFTFLLAAPGVFAANFMAESCGTLVGPPPGFPFDETNTPTADDFNLSGCLGDTSGINDLVLCFTPENRCDIFVEVFYADEQIEPNIGIALTTGACDPTPSSCLAAAGNGGIGGATTLGAGVPVCLIVEAAIEQEPVRVAISSEGDCGNLPVELEGFSVSR